MGNMLLALIIMKRCIFIGLFLVLFSTLFVKAQVKEHLISGKTAKIDKCKYFVDFEKDRAGTLVFNTRKNSSADSSTVVFYLGEKLIAPQTVDSTPPGTVRFQKVVAKVGKGQHKLKLNAFQPPGWAAKLGQAVPEPLGLGPLMPFRYVNIIDPDGLLDLKSIKHTNVYFDQQDQFYFKSDNSLLDSIIDLCKHTIIATSYLGLYVDGDRERCPYEADAYINQLSQYALNGEISLTRKTFEYLLKKPTWPTEWHYQMVFIAFEDLLRTKDVTYWKNYLPELKRLTQLKAIYTTEGLICDTIKKRKNDIIDWPQSERDQYVLTDCNSVPNAFMIAAKQKLAYIAKFVGEKALADSIFTEVERLTVVYNRSFYDPKIGLYRDGITTNHSSSHANFFPLAFGLVPATYKQKVTDYCTSKGMVCSVYGAQFLLQALFQEGKTEEALDLILSRKPRSWHNMMREGSTMTMEAWGQSWKPNQDWNHAWGTAPLNLIYNYLVGIQQDLGMGYIIKPHLPKNFGFEATNKLKQGEIKVKYTVDKDSQIYNIQINFQVAIQFNESGWMLAGKAVGGLMTLKSGKHIFVRQKD